MAHLGLAALAITAAPVNAQTAEPDSGATPSLSAAVNQSVAESAAALLEKNYVFPELGAKYATALRDHAARGEYARIVSHAELADRMTADLQAVAPDGHRHFYTIRPRQEEKPAMAASTASTTPHVPGIREMKWLKPGVAYMAFEHFDDRPEAMGAVRDFLRDYASARALIIDSRANHGGAFDMMGLLANHLFATERKLADMDMAKAIVDHFGGTQPIGGGLELFVPIGHTTDPATGLDWERVGIAPDIDVPAASALEEALRKVAMSTEPSAR